METVRNDAGVEVEEDAEFPADDAEFPVDEFADEDDADAPVSVQRGDVPVVTTI